MKLKTSEFKLENVKSKKELEEEREAIILAAISRIKEESSSLTSRVKFEEQKRVEYIKEEEERQKRADALRQEAMIKSEEERRIKIEAERKAKVEREEQIRLEKLEQQRLMQERLKQEEEERLRRRQQEKIETKKTDEVMKKQSLLQMEESKRMEELKIIEERKLQERLQLESMIQKEKEYIKKGIVTRRSDDPYGQGFGFVKTGYVSSQKLSILERAASVERTVSPTWSTASSKGAKGLRVTWAESPGSSRPGSKMSGTDKVAEFEALALQSETPPLAGEWAVSKGMESQAYSQKSVISSQASSKSIVQQSQSSSSSSMAAEVSNKIAVKESPEKVAQIDAPVVPSETLPSVGELALTRAWRVMHSPKKVQSQCHLNQ